MLPSILRLIWRTMKGHMVGAFRAIPKVINQIRKTNSASTKENDFRLSDTESYRERLDCDERLLDPYRSCLPKEMVIDDAFPHVEIALRKQ